MPDDFKSLPRMPDTARQQYARWLASGEPRLIDKSSFFTMNRLLAARLGSRALVFEPLTEIPRISVESGVDIRFEPLWVHAPDDAKMPCNLPASSHAEIVGFIRRHRSPPANQPDEARKITSKVTFDFYSSACWLCGIEPVFDAERLYQVLVALSKLRR